jgi:hypothetical protein
MQLPTSEFDMASNAPLEVFYSYAHEDEDLRDELEKHLKLLQRNGLIANWHDRRIAAGGEWRDEIDAHARSAHVILLLISADFVASDYCYGVEMKLALERHARRDAIVIPVILRPVDWSAAPFARLQALPRNAKPITTWSNRDEAFAEVARGIREIVSRFRTRPPQEQGDRPSLVDEYVPKQRVLDAAIPSYVVKDEPAELLILIRLPDSVGLSGALLDDEEAEARPEDVRSKPFDVVFPLRPDGRPDSVRVEVRLTSPDFFPPQQSKNLFVPPDADSEVCHFLLTPKRIGRLKVLIELQWEDLLHGSRRLRTECVAEAGNVPASSGINVVQVPVNASVGKTEAELSGWGAPTPVSPVSVEERQSGWDKGSEASAVSSVIAGDEEEKSPPARSNPSLSAIGFAGVAFVGLLLALGFTFFYVYQVPKLVEDGTEGKIFYLLLIPWALASAAFLFGAMRSYAHFSQRHLGNFLELGGPVVLFCLVLVGGFKLVPQTAETFDLAVRAHSADTALISLGQITLDLPGLPHASIGQDGEANFKGLSAKLKGKAIRVLPKIDGYEEKWLTPTIEGNVLTVELERAHPTFVQKATLVPPPVRGKTIQIRVDGQKIDARPDELGGFTFTANGKAGDRVSVEVFVDQRLASSEYYVLSARAIDIHWNSLSQKAKR